MNSPFFFDSSSHLVLTTYASILNAYRSLGLLLREVTTRKSNGWWRSEITIPLSSLMISRNCLAEASPCSIILTGSLSSSAPLISLFELSTATWESLAPLAALTVFDLFAAVLRAPNLPGSFLWDGGVLFSFSLGSISYVLSKDSFST